jgi:hypothetical protein
MAESVLTFDNSWPNQASVSAQLRRQKRERSLKQANAQRLQAQTLGASSGINERLMSRQQKQADQSSAVDSTDTNINKADDSDSADSLKQIKQLAKLATNPTVGGVATMAAEQAAKAIENGGAAKLLTGPLLSASWKTLITSYGLTLIYLNIHVWAGFIEGHKVFCKLGEEVKAPGLFKKALGFMEVIAILALDLLVFLILLAVVAIAVFIINIMVDGLTIENFKILWNLFGGALNSLIE